MWNCVCVCVCVGGALMRISGREGEKETERGGRTVVFTLRTALLLQLSSLLHMSHALSTRLRVSLYLPRPPPLPLCSVRQFKFVLFNSDSVKLKKYHTDYNLAHRMRARAKDWPIKATGFGRDNSQQITTNTIIKVTRNHEKYHRKKR